MMSGNEFFGIRKHEGIIIRPTNTAAFTTDKDGADFVDRSVFK
jgi:hypothetical protein